MNHHSMTQEIPDYLKPYVATQDPSLYTPMDHASWRYILRISQAFFAKNAHQKYLDGLRETGISVERIPLIEEMNACLRKFNWQAVPVIGFIPPAVFMEFLSLGVLPIACDMRTIDHLAYTPAPDIVHEAAGHAPIIADPEYAAYLRSYGEISRKAIFSSQDMNVYLAIRLLSDLKENPNSTSEQIQKAEKGLEDALQAVTFVSEATLLARMGWWTFEYGLVGSIEKPQIYGAGLLSSVGESYRCFDPAVKKIPFSIRCVETSYDITRPQPQLYVASDFQELTNALNELADRMAFRLGGIEALRRARQAGTVTTTVLDSGIQISGVLKDWISDGENTPCYLQMTGPTQLAYEDQEVPGHGAKYHQQGFGSPLEWISEDQLKKAGFLPGKKAKLEFKSGVSLEGVWVNSVQRSGKPVILTFKDCTVKKGDQVLFRPEWGTYDLVCGETVTSVFGGAADRKAYLAATGGYGEPTGQQKTNLTPENRELNQLYARVRSHREAGTYTSESVNQLDKVSQILEQKYPKEWLLRYELLEISLTHRLNRPWEKKFQNQLEEIRDQSPELAETIQRGLDLLK
jgi:phenylalanine-4-hydroxylase